jgi:hypothetical protein
MVIYIANMKESHKIIIVIFNCVLGSLHLHLFLIFPLFFLLLGINKSCAIEDIFFLYFALPLLWWFRLLVFLIFLLLLQPLLLFSLLFCPSFLILPLFLDNFQFLLGCLDISPLGLSIEEEKEFLSKYKQVILIEVIHLFIRGMFIEPFPNWFSKLRKVFIVFENLIACFDIAVATLGSYFWVDKRIPSK